MNLKLNLMETRLALVSIRILSSKFLCFLLLLTIAIANNSASAQYAYFVEDGNIEYEKRVNMFAKLKGRADGDNVFMKKIYEEYVRTQPQFHSSKSILSFSRDKSVYKFLEEETQGMSNFANDPWLMVKNEVNVNFNTDTITALKRVYGDEFVVKDIKPSILWKLTNEEREIAGYKCKRANGLVADSIYVVAFYAEEILPSGGPESFGGLPGMILGLALPHENITWFATKVEATKSLKNGNIQMPKKAKMVTRKEFEENLQKAMSDWGAYGTDIIKAFSL